MNFDRRFLQDLTDESIAKVTSFINGGGEGIVLVNRANAIDYLFLGSSPENVPVKLSKFVIHISRFDGADMKEIGTMSFDRVDLVRGLDSIYLRGYAMETAVFELPVDDVMFDPADNDLFR